jgi:multiple sugar transport system substrate-binding protein
MRGVGQVQGRNRDVELALKVREVGSGLSERGSLASLSRRRFLQALALAGVSASSLLAACTGGGGGAVASATGGAVATGTKAPPQRPPTALKPNTLVYAGNTWADQLPVMKAAADRFKSTEGVAVQLLELGDAEYLQKILGVYAAGQQMDTVYIREPYLASWAQSGLLQPITKLPGLDQYLQDATEIALGAIKYKGDVWGLPQQGDVLVIFYHEGNFKKAGLSTPPKTWDELVAQCLQAQKAGFTYPIVWAAGQGDTHLPWQWYGLVNSRGGTIFDAAGATTMGKGSVARDTLQWWQDTFQKSKISDPRSAELRYIPHGKAFMTGNYVFGGLSFYAFMNTLNDPAQSPIAGQVKEFQMPGNGKSLGYARSIGLAGSTKYPEWAYEFDQFMGATDLTGKYAIPKEISASLGFIPLYKQLFNDPDVKAAWSKFQGFDQMTKTVGSAVHYSQIVSAVYQTWFAEWQDTSVNVQLQNCILGKTSPDAACDAMAAKAEELRKR